MNVDWSLPRQIFLAIMIIGCVGTYPLLKFGTNEIFEAVIIGAILTTVNVLLGYAAIEYSLGKSTTTFFKFVIGGMGIRLFLMAVILVLLIKVFQLHVGALISSMGIFYVVFLTLEVFYIQKKINSKQQS
jgi:Ca2+/H+ antiporter